jgi:hypothetical protein
MQELELKQRSIYCTDEKWEKLLVIAISENHKSRTLALRNLIKDKFNE